MISLLKIDLFNKDYMYSKKLFEYSNDIRVFIRILFEKKLYPIFEYYSNNFPILFEYSNNFPILFEYSNNIRVSQIIRQSRWKKLNSEGTNTWLDINLIIIKAFEYSLFSAGNFRKYLDTDKYAVGVVDRFSLIELQPKLFTQHLFTYSKWWLTQIWIQLGAWLYTCKTQKKRKKLN